MIFADIHKFSADHPQYAGVKPTSYLGGKGAYLDAMCGLGINVPEGYIIPTDVCANYLGNGYEKEDLPELADDIVADLKKELNGKPFMVSVRSGAPVSMPGMMDTILNVGMCEADYSYWFKAIGQRATFDSHRRLLQMMGTTVHDIPASAFEDFLEEFKTAAGAPTDADLSVMELQAVITGFKGIYAEHDVTPIKHPVNQVLECIKAVFHSWNSPRAKAYRKHHDISDDIYTAVVIQMMVFGNRNEKSGSGVLFTRNPATGEKAVYGEYLPIAQGEDVVAGIRTPHDLTYLAEQQPHVHDKLMVVCKTLEKFYRDMVDIEFTVDDGTLYILQSRVGKRTAQAAFKIASDMLNEKAVTSDELKHLVSFDDFKAMDRVMVGATDVEPDVTGKPAGPGVAKGVVVFTVEDAIENKGNCVLFRKETTPDDFEGMVAANAVVTTHGGLTSHAAVVARSINKTCVVGCGGMTVEGGSIVLGDPADAIYAGSEVTVCGDTGRIWFGKDIPVIDASNDESFTHVCGVIADKESELMITLTTVLSEPKDALIAKAAKYDRVIIDLAPEDDGWEFKEWLALPTINVAESHAQDFAIDLIKDLSGYKPVRVFGANHDQYLELCGYPVELVMKVTTMSEFVDAATMEFSHEFVDGVGQDVLDKLMSVYDAAGTPKTLASQSYPVEYDVICKLKGVQ